MGRILCLKTRMIWVKWSQWSVRRLLCRCICSNPVGPIILGALYQFPHASFVPFPSCIDAVIASSNSLLLLLAFFPSILAIRDYSIWQVLWDPTINRVKAAAASISDASEHSFHMPLLFFHGASPFGVPNGYHRHHMVTLLGYYMAAAGLIWFTLLTCGSLYILIYYCYYNKHFQLRRSRTIEYRRCHHTRTSQ